MPTFVTQTSAEMVKVVFFTKTVFDKNPPVEQVQDSSTRAYGY